MSYERQVDKYRLKLANMKYSCSTKKTNSLKDRCIRDTKGKYNTQTECVFSDECNEIQLKFKITPEDILYQEKFMKHENSSLFVSSPDEI